MATPTDPILAHIGRVEISPARPVIAGSYHDFTLTYTAGFYGIDDTGSLKFCFRYATDMATPQFSRPAEESFVRVSASNGARLAVSYDTKGNVRPWGKTIYVKVLDGFFRKGDKLTLHFGDRSEGSPGIRMQTFCEETWEIKVLVDPIATFTYYEVPNVPTFPIVPGPAARWIAQIPTHAEEGEDLRLLIKAEDEWGNPTSDTRSFQSSSSIETAGLPNAVAASGKPPYANVVSGIAAQTSGTLVLSFDDGHGTTFRSNPCRVRPQVSYRQYWGDMHGQSEETIGTNSVDDYFHFARDAAGLDFAAHQGNDFQITADFWRQLQLTTKSFNQDGRFIVFPGYEWSGNTALGGDHNVFYFEEGETIHRSSHALIHDDSDIESDAPQVRDLFRKLKGRKALVIAHVGGRYSELAVHEEELQRSVEIHSAWGTFEWILNDALQRGYRVGVVANSDGHKGRPGASYPGASLFGSYGGLTCILARDLTREAIWEAFQQRHHYATTGARIFLEVTARQSDEDGASASASRLDGNRPSSGEAPMMGDAAIFPTESISLQVSVSGTAPITCVEVRIGWVLVESFRPYSQNELGSRILVVWRGASFRGRGRQADWSGAAELRGNGFLKAVPINFHNPERRLQLDDEKRVSWQSITTGGLSGFCAALKDSDAGELSIDTPLIHKTVSISDIDMNELAFDAGGVDRRLQISRLPDRNDHFSFEIQCPVRLLRGRDNPLYVCVHQEDGHLAWSSPIYCVVEST